MKKSRLLCAVCAVAFSVITLPSHAITTLIGVLPATTGGTDYQAYYDPAADLTWLANADAAGTTMNWATANAWAAVLDIDGIAGADGWRLPTTLQPDSSCGTQVSGVSSGYNCTGSEMGNLFYNVLGGVAGSSITTTHNPNYDLFSNVQSYAYWSSTVYAPNNLNAWRFGFAVGTQFDTAKNNGFYAWAVQSGNAGVVGVVPVPAAVWLFGFGLLGLIGVARRRKTA
jgi:hypothetical protein